MRIFLAEITSVRSFIQYKKVKVICVINIAIGLKLLLKVKITTYVILLLHALHVFMLNV